MGQGLTAFGADVELSSSPVDADGEARFVLLNDQPVEDVGADLLGAADAADGLAALVASSQQSSPFVVAVDAGWGMGKSSLLRLIEFRLSGRSGIKSVRFNAWTASDHGALEGLIKSVLIELDTNVLRRWTRRLAHRRHLVHGARIGLAIVAGLFGVASMVDELWKQLAVDARSRHDLRELIHGMLSDWAGGGNTGRPRRTIAVFVDDLDRCSDEVVVQVCEAIKLYLDAPGLIFFVACDQSVIARGVAGSARGGIGEGRSYLEKIVQVTYRVPPPQQENVHRLIEGYARRSGMEALIDETVSEILAERAGRNPRRIKRIVNSFVVEYQINPVWRQPPLGNVQLVTAILLQQLYTPFYDILAADEYAPNPLEEFLEYVDLRARISSPPKTGDPWWMMVARIFSSHGLPVPESPDALASAIEALERTLPEDYPALARSGTFVALLGGLGDATIRQAMRAQLVSRPLATESVVEDADLRFAADNTLSGWRVICVDDNPDSLFTLISRLERSGASVVVYSDDVSAERAILRQPPDALVSDITRGEDYVAGFDSVERLRKSGYEGPVVFFTGRVTPERRQRATALGAAALVTSEHAVIEALQEINRAGTLR